ncbi:thioesterase family protein [bacterium]|nr:thioesterase family protein [bacterium]
MFTIVLPNDLDLTMHMNNGRYLTICDFNRVDLFVRSGLGLGTK